MYNVAKNFRINFSAIPATPCYATCNEGNANLMDEFQKVRWDRERPSPEAIRKIHFYIAYSRREQPPRGQPPRDELSTTETNGCLTFFTTRTFPEYETIRALRAGASSRCMTQTGKRTINLRARGSESRCAPRPELKLPRWIALSRSF